MAKKNETSKPIREPLFRSGLPAQPERPVVLAMAHVPLAEIRKSFEGLADRYPPVLSLEQAAELSRLSPATLKRKASEGCFSNCVRRGKPLRFWRDRFVQEIIK